MNMFSSSVWDRLIGPVHPSAGQHNPLRLTLAQYQRVIARDLEVLLNTRSALAADELLRFPACRDSVERQLPPLSATLSVERHRPCRHAGRRRQDDRGQHHCARRHDAADPYAGDREISTKKGKDKREATDAALGNEETEASARYEDHARLCMQARRAGFAAKTDEHVVAEDKPETASADCTAWRSKKIKAFLADNIDAHATDHSTIMTNPMHARRALTYDVAIGHCHILDADLHRLRIAADWRFLDGLGDDDPIKAFREYFVRGKFKGTSAFDWANRKNCEGQMPDKIVDLREHQPRGATHVKQGGCG